MKRNPYINPFFQIESIFSKKKTLWDELNLVVQKKYLGISGYNWPQETFMTCDAWIALFNERLEPHLASDFTLDLNNIYNRNALLASLMTVTTWRFCQNSYNLNEDITQQTMSNPTAAMISPTHFNNMTEWATCIPLQNQFLSGRKIFNLYAHKSCMNTHGGSQFDPDCLILTFNLEPLTEDVVLREKDRNFKPFPYVIFRADRLDSLKNALVEYGAFPVNYSSTDDFLEFINPFMAIFNTVFDPLSSIESEFVGVKKPDYSDVETNINFNDMNFPTIKHPAVSNLRHWAVANNIYAKLKQKQRRENLLALPLIKWEKTDSSLILSV